MTNLNDAYTDRSEGRWWIMHWTPAGMIVRLLTSYPDKTSALGAIATLGYQAVPKPEMRETVKRTTQLPSWRVEARTTRPTDTTHCTVTVHASDDFDAAMAARRWLHEVYGHADWAIDAVNCLTVPTAPDLHEHPIVRHP